MSLARTGAAVLALCLTATGLAACAAIGLDGGAEVVRVPGDAPTITEAIDAVAPNGLVLVAPGVYEEEVLIDKAGVTVRGEDRNRTVIDAGGVRPYGVVGVADGVTVQNLTVTGATFYGVLVTGMFTEDGPEARGSSGYTSLDPEEFPPLQRFLVDHVTAYNNGLYGIYAFDAQHGAIRDSYASGSADSGIYVGQCRECNILVSGNRAVDNAVGFENANASDSVWVVENDFSGNRIGMTFISNYQEAFAPQRENWVVGNLVSDSTSTDSPSHAQGGWGIGIGLSGATANRFERNVITDQPSAGVVLSNAEDIATTDNLFVDNVFASNAVDVVNTSSDRAFATGNCFDTGIRLLPASLAEACESGQAAAAGDAFSPLDAPPGVSFLKVAHPVPQPDLGPSEELPAPLPKQVERPEIDRIRVPGTD